MKSQSALILSLLIWLIPTAGQSQTNTFPSSGNVGIGTTSPSAKLEVVGRSHFGTGTDNVANTVNGLSIQDQTGAPIALAVGRNTGRSVGLIWYDDTATGSAVLYTFSKAAPISILASTISLASAGSDASLFITAQSNVGIGTTNASAPLTIKTVDNDYLGIYGPVNNSVALQTIIDGRTLSTYPYGGDENRLLLQPLVGQVGIGLTDPKAKLHVQGNPLGSSVGDKSNLLTLQSINSNESKLTIVQLRHTAGTAWEQATTRIQQFTDVSGQGYIDFNPANGGQWGLGFGTGTTEHMRIQNSGNVAIGTTNATHKLTVNGTIRAKEVIVDTGWSDYVFAPDYRLAPLGEVEQHIKENKHLPGIPSAKEVSEQGINIGAMQAKLLAKIEELTLHQIAQEKQIQEQQRLTKSQQAEIQALRAELRAGNPTPFK